MRKPGFCICENKGAADQRLCFNYTDSTVLLLHKTETKPLTIFCGCTAQFVSDLVGNPEDRFSRGAAHFVFERKFYKSCNLIVSYFS